MFPAPRSILFYLVLTLATTAVAGDYYKWVDASGSVHLADSLEGVPPQYRNQIEAGEMAETPLTPSAIPSDSASPDDAATIGGGAAAATPTPPELPRYEVAYHEYEGLARRILVQARINDRITVPMAIDTGAPETMISLSLARRLGLFEGDDGALLVTTGGIGGRDLGVRVILDKVEIGGAVNPFVPATVIRAPISDQFDGLIGMGFVSLYQVNIDPTRSLIVFQELPASDDAPGGRSEQWWRNTFKDFGGYRSAWQHFRDELRKTRRSTNAAMPGVDRQLAVAESQYREAEKLYDTLKRYAIEHYVPMAWRQ